MLKLPIGGSRTTTRHGQTRVWLVFRSLMWTLECSILAAKVTWGRGGRYCSLAAS